MDVPASISRSYDRDGFHDGKYVWVAQLSDGGFAYQDEDLYPGLAWNRLEKYVKENNLSITNIGVKLSSHEEWPFPPNQKGYYASRGMIGFLDGRQIHTLVIGYVSDKLYTQTYKCPELLEVEKDERDPSEYECIYV